MAIREITVFVSAGEESLPGVRIRFAIGGSVVADQLTGSGEEDGITVFSLEDGTYALAVSKAGFNSYFDSVIVNSDNELDVGLTALSAPVSSAPETCRCFTYRISNGVPLSGQSISYRLATAPPGDGLVCDRSTQPSAPSGSDGLITVVDAPIGSVYQFWFEDGPKQTLLIPNADELLIPTLVNRFNA